MLRPDIRSDSTEAATRTAARVVSRAAARAGMVVVLLLMQTKQAAAEENTFPAGAMSQLSSVVDAYEARKKERQQWLSEELWRRVRPTGDILDHGVWSSARDKWFLEFGGLSRSLDTILAYSRQYGRDPENLRDYPEDFTTKVKEWCRREQEEVEGAYDLCCLAVLDSLELESRRAEFARYADALEAKGTHLQKMAQAMSKLYVHGEDVLAGAAGRSGDVLGAEARTMQLQVYHARVLREALALHVEAIDKLPETFTYSNYSRSRSVPPEQSGWESLAGDSPGWTRAYQAFIEDWKKQHADAKLEFDRMREAVEPYLRETLLQECGPPFKDLKYDRIPETFSSLYGKLCAAAGR